MLLGTHAVCQHALIKLHNAPARAPNEFTALKLALYTPRPICKFMEWETNISLCFFFSILRLSHFTFLRLTAKNSESIIIFILQITSSSSTVREEAEIF